MADQADEKSKLSRSSLEDQWARLAAVPRKVCLKVTVELRATGTAKANVSLLHPSAEIRAAASSQAAKVHEAEVLDLVARGDERQDLRLAR